MTWWPRSVWFLMAVGSNTSPTEALWPAGGPCTQSEAALCAHIINKDGFDYKSDESVALSSLNMKSHIKSGGGFLTWYPVALETGHNLTTGVRSYTEVWAVCVRIVTDPNLYNCIQSHTNSWWSSSWGSKYSAFNSVNLQLRKHWTRFGL